jgi:hypothetical protein
MLIAVEPSLASFDVKQFHPNGPGRKIEGPATICPLVPVTASIDAAIPGASKLLQVTRLHHLEDIQWNQQTHFSWLRRRLSRNNCLQPV